MADFSISFRSWDSNANRYTVNGYYDESFPNDPALPATIHGAFRNWLTKGWETEILAVAHRPKDMKPHIFHSRESRYFSALCEQWPRDRLDASAEDAGDE